MDQSRIQTLQPYGLLGAVIMHAETAYLFRHALMREAAYQLHPPADRAVLHKLALEVLEQLLPADALVELAEELADHAHDAMAAAADAQEARQLGESEVRYLLQAGEFAAGKYEAERAISILSRAAALPAGTAEHRFRALMAAANARIGQGQFGPARLLLNGVNLQGLSSRQLCEWRLRLSEVDLRTARYADVLDHARQAFAEAESAGHSDFMARAVAMRASAHMLSGKLDEALAEYQQALELAKQAGDTGAAAQAEVNTASILRRRGRRDEAEAILRRAVTAFAQAGHGRHLAIAQQNLSNLMYDMGRMEEAEQWLNTAEATYRKVGDRNGIANVTGARGIQYHYERNFERAAAAYRQSAELFHEVGAPRGEMRNWANLGTALILLGQLDEATFMAERALALARQIGDRESEGIYIGQRGAAHKQAGRTDAALADLRSSVDISDREVGARTPQVLVNYCHLCDLLHGLGDAAGARHAADRARELRKLVSPEILARDIDALAALESLDRYPAAQSPHDPA